MLPREAAGHKTRDILFPQAIHLQSIVGGPQSLAYTLGHYLGNVHTLLLSKSKDAPHAGIQKKCISELTQEPPENVLAALEREEMGTR